MVAFDAAAAIAEFSEDSSRTSLQLPHMTTGERKIVKKLLDAFPELHCKSFGFGQERQLHILKHDATKQDDEINCCEKTLGSSALNDLSLLSVERNIIVRNTFLDIESTIVDERVVKSMPHGMFSKCVLAELANAAFQESITEPEAEPSAKPKTVEASDDSPPLLPGACVVVEGLTKLPAFNGLTAVVQGWDEASGRYDIMLVTGAGSQQAKIKSENLRLLTSPR